jgi:hypothetical protein
VLLLFWSELPVLDPVLLPPGLKAPPVAEPAPARPKYEKTLWRQLGWVKSVVASKVGADCNLLWSPANVKVGELVPVAEAPADDERNNIHGTATCLPPAVGLVELVEPIPVLLVLELLLVAELPPSLSEMTANSSRPEFGLTMKSLIEPI